MKVARWNELRRHSSAPTKKPIHITNADLTTGNLDGCGDWMSVEIELHPLSL